MLVQYERCSYSYEYIFKFKLQKSIHFWEFDKKNKNGVIDTNLIQLVVW